MALDKEMLAMVRIKAILDRLPDYDTRRRVVNYVSQRVEVDGSHGMKRESEILKAQFNMFPEMTGPRLAEVFDPESPAA